MNYGTIDSRLLYSSVLTCAFSTTQFQSEMKQEKNPKIALQTNYLNTKHSFLEN